MAEAQEHFWGVELSKENPTYTWTFEKEDEDNDYLIHTLFLKTAVLGTSAVKGERNLVQIETENFDKNEVKLPLLSLTLGQSDMCNVDISFGNEVQATFRLTEGSGPIALSGQQLVEFPPDELNISQDDVEDSVESELTEEEESPKKSKKRKAAAVTDKISKKGKMEESSEDSVDDEEDEEEEEEDDEEDMEESESSPEKDDKKKKKGAKDQKGKKGPKTTKISPKKSAKKSTKKGKK